MVEARKDAGMKDMEKRLDNYFLSRTLQKVCIELEMWLSDTIPVQRYEDLSSNLRCPTFV